MTLPIEKRGECCVPGEPASIDQCAKCPDHPIAKFHDWLSTYGKKLTYHQGDMAASWYAGRRQALSSAMAQSLPSDAALVADTVERVANEQPIYRETTIHNLKRAAEILRTYVLQNTPK
jgi:hypothetical protein